MKALFGGANVECVNRGARGSRAILLAFNLLNFIIRISVARHVGIRDKLKAPLACRGISLNKQKKVGAGGGGCRLSLVICRIK